MLIRAGEEERIAPRKPLEPRVRIANSRGVDMPNVRTVIHIVDGRGDVADLIRHAAIVEQIAQYAGPLTPTCDSSRMQPLILVLPAHARTHADDQERWRAALIASDR